ncbi:YaiI/YqxD family protein [Parahaliea aestuarii]|uniref:UPF0178 protein FVW59_06825 n=1 Tax=Parahaliea aestuarii TaxID=1852021 RepID=A0A5C8ZY55_9GAMM|nr:YaiI/YqxD family protein [Parahaliea aestuarii]TXS93533.1 YaiI/YqxD family protein [Parahaliea aestuarii]
MHIWVDADACPGAIKEILFRAAQRTGIGLTLVANHAMQVPKAPNIRFVQVERGFDVADNLIVERAEEGDLVITADIPLAAEVVARGASGLSPRGERYTADNIRARLNMRDFMATLRDTGVETGGAPPLGQADRQRFASCLDQMLAQASP